MNVVPSNYLIRKKPSSSRSQDSVSSNEGYPYSEYIHTDDHHGPVAQIDKSELLTVNKVNKGG